MWHCTSLNLGKRKFHLCYVADILILPGPPDTPDVEDALQALLDGRLVKEGHAWSRSGNIHKHLHATS